MAKNDRSDFELLAEWRAGGRDAGNCLFDRHFASVYAFFRSKLEDVAEDLTQQTFLRCLEACDDFRTEASFRTYLFAIARNVFYGDLRRRSRSRDIDVEVLALPDLGVSSSAFLELREEHKLLVRALRRLPDDLQVALELYYVQHVRGRALVAALGVAPGTVRSRIRRGIERLRVVMEELVSI
jgi:RNA polymerase sigma factor (sigma-70 family)